MNVLSLFDGISCGSIALERANIEVNNYYASEIDKYATKISEANYPSIIRIGDVTKWQEWDIDWGSIDLVTAGFPCQAWSLAGKQLGDKDPRGVLFWTTLDVISNVLKHNPNAKFLMENVKMKKEFKDYITHHTEQVLGYVEKTLINSALVSAQNRNRFYWTNFKVTQPEDKGILLRDIIDYSLSGQFYRPCKLLDKPTKGGHIANATDIKGNESIKRAYSVDSKAPTLTTMAGGHREPKILIDRDKSYCLDANYAKGGNPDQYFIKKRRQLVFLENDNEILYRKLTPLECERLQTLPDNYTAHVSNTQRYKSIGNGWSVDVIAHILRGAF